MSMDFTRSESGLSNSFALGRFRKDRGELSDYLWTSILASDILQFSLIGQQGSEHPKTALDIRDNRFDNRIGNSVDELRRMHQSGQRWQRLSVLVLLTSAFERFMTSIVDAAVASDPALKSGFPKRLDGLLIEKYGLKLTRPDTLGVVKGEWAGRISSYEKLFGNAPQELKDSVNFLEDLRKTRNFVAHSFGMDEQAAGHDSLTSVILGARSRDRLAAGQASISQERLIEALNLFGKISIAVDRHLLKDFIGSYESAEIYLRWKKDPAKFERKLGITLAPHAYSHDLRFHHVFRQTTGSSYGKKYTEQLIEYVESL